MRDASDSAKLRLERAPPPEGDLFSVPSPAAPSVEPPPSRPITLLGLGPFTQSGAGDEEHSRVAFSPLRQTPDAPGASVQDLPIPKVPPRASTLPAHAVARERSDRPVSATVRPRARSSSISAPTPASASRAALALALFAFAASTLITVLVLREVIPGRGSVLVTAVGAAGMPVSGAHVLVDGVLACSPVPCRVPKLKAGRHEIAVAAPGYQRTADKVVRLEAGSESLVHFGLTPEEGAGLRGNAHAPGLLLDGGGTLVTPRQTGPAPPLALPSGVPSAILPAQQP